VTFRDHFSGHAAEYREFRPAYPPELFAFLASLAPGRGLAWDCGTGNGQAAAGLAEHFEAVVATDASAKQIEQAEPHPKVKYAIATAEHSPLTDASVDLTVVAQALHWFDHDRFYPEVRRVSRLGAVFAATCYFDVNVKDRVNRVLARFQDLVRPHWPAGRAWVDAGYTTIPFPFEPIRTPRFELTLDSDLPRFLGYLQTWSATKVCAKTTGGDPVAMFAEAFAEAWGDPAAIQTVRWAFNVRAARVS